MITPMTKYGFGLGFIAGGLVGLSLGLSSLGDSTVLMSLVYTIYGSLFGGIFGGLSGFFSGVAMITIMVITFPHWLESHYWRLMMGATTAVVTGYMLFSGLWGFGYGMELIWAITLLLSVVIAVCISQIVLKSFINEISDRKKKGTA